MHAWRIVGVTGMSFVVLFVAAALALFVWVMNDCRKDNVKDGPWLWIYGAMFCISCIIDIVVGVRLISELVK